MDFLAELLAKPATVQILIIALCVLAIFFAGTFRHVVRSSQLALKSATAILEEIPSHVNFAHNRRECFDRITSVFAKKRLLSRQWGRYQSEVFDAQEGACFSYRQPHEFFNSEFLLRDRWLPLCKAGPSYLVGLGLVFTFLGIAVVIYRASLALGSDNDLPALRGLLGAASLKFWTSLAGVFLSVITSGYFRHLTAGFNVAASEFSHALSTRVRFLSQEYSLQLSNIYLERQSEALNELRTTLLVREEESSNRIVKELQLLQKSMMSVAEDTFSELVEKSASELSSAITNSLQGVAQTFISVNDAFNDILEQVKPLPESFRSLSQEVNRTTTEVALQLQGVGETLLSDLNRAKSSSAAIAAEFSLTVNCAEQIRASLDGIPNTVAKVSESLSQLVYLQDVSQKLHEAAAAMRTSSDALVVNWEQQAQHVSAIDDKLGHTVATLPTVFGQYSEALQKFADDFDNHLGRVLGSLATQIESLGSSQDSLRGIAEMLAASLNNRAPARTGQPL